MLKTAIFYGKCALVFLLILEIFLLIYELYKKAKKKEELQEKEELPKEKPANAKEMISKDNQSTSVEKSSEEAMENLSAQSSEESGNTIESSDSGESNPASSSYPLFQKKAVGKMDEEGNILEVYDSVKKAALSVGVTPKRISRCLTGKQEHAGGYRWCYIPNKQ